MILCHLKTTKVPFSSRRTILTTTSDGASYRQKTTTYKTSSNNKQGKCIKNKRIIFSYKTITTQNPVKKKIKKWQPKHWPRHLALCRHSLPQQLFLLHQSVHRPSHPWMGQKDPSQDPWWKTWLVWRPCKSLSHVTPQWAIYIYFSFIWFKFPFIFFFSS